MSETKNANGTAFPASADFHTEGGLTKREYVATKVLSALIAGFDKERKVNAGYIASTDHKYLVAEAIEITNELLKQPEQ